MFLTLLINSLIAKQHYYNNIRYNTLCLCFYFILFCFVSFRFVLFSFLFCFCVCFLCLFLFLFLFCFFKMFLQPALNILKYFLSVFFVISSHVTPENQIITAVKGINQHNSMCRMYFLFDIDAD